MQVFRRRASAGAASLLSLALSLFFLLTVATAQPETINFSIDSAVLNALVADIEQEFFPLLVKEANAFIDANLTSTTQQGDCCKLGDIGVIATARIFDFELGAVAQNQIELTTSRSSIPNTARIGVVGKQLKVSAKAQTGVGAAFLVPLACFIGARAQITIPRIEFSVDVTIEPNTNGQVVSVALGAVQLPFANVLLIPIVDNICSALTAIIAIAFNTLSFALSQLVLPLLRGAFSNAVNRFLGETELDFRGLVPGFELGNSSIFTPDIGIARVSSDEGVIGSGLATFFTSELLEPEWRAGRKLVKVVSPDRALPPATITAPSIVSFNLG